MTMHKDKNQMVWLLVGIIAGLGVANMWPRQTAMAVTNDRNERYAMATAEISIISDIECVFLLDFLTTEIKGYAISSKTGKFTNFYYRNLAADFDLPQGIQPHFTFATGTANLPTQRTQKTVAKNVVYVAEHTTGKLNAYAFTHAETNRALPVEELVLIESVQWREPSP